MPKKKPDPEIKKALAKVGMTTSMGVAVATAPFLKGSRLMKNLHTGAATLGLAFALWHHFLYKPAKKKKAKKAIAEK